MFYIYRFYCFWFFNLYYEVIYYVYDIKFFVCIFKKYFLMSVYIVSVIYSSIYLFYKLLYFWFYLYILWDKVLILWLIFELVFF